jgi:hypothetical protein
MSGPAKVRPPDGAIGPKGPEAFDMPFVGATNGKLLIEV